MIKQIKKLIPREDSHKGQNGKILIIGGSELFHAASKWSLDVASRFVDMVFYASTPENNELVKKNKGEFWNGIVVNQEMIGDYIKEAEVVLMGPGMTRDEKTKLWVDKLLKEYPDKKWVLDAGALQVADLEILPKRAILTPHEREMERFKGAKVGEQVFLLKGVVDKIIQNGEIREEIRGGNAGMTKGGTGDCLAGLVAAVWTKIDDEIEAAKVASTICKAAGDDLYQGVGTFFNASDLAAAIPKTAWRLASSD
ncbi:NAD(P)H-hydrate dehydratase [Microgenomates group bacterium]|nr:NAD(P)H-hydrate dehydratase [Microgenomates group bacterium]